MKEMIKEIIIEILILLLCMTACGREGAEIQEEVEVQKEIGAQEEVSMLDAYEAILADRMPTEAQAMEPAGFALIYLDDDEIPELAVIEGWAHSSGASIYTCEQGEAVFVGKYGQYGAMGYRQKEGIVFDDYDQGGNIYSRVYQIDKSNSTLLLSYSECWTFSETEESAVTYSVDGQEVTREQYQEASERWSSEDERVIDYGMCVFLTEKDIRQSLEEQHETLILTQKEVLRQKVLAESGLEEDAVLMMDYDDYDRDGKCEAFMFCGKRIDVFDGYYTLYDGGLWFVGEKECVLLREGAYRMLDGSMKLGPNQKYIYLYSDINFTANDSELWTVIDGKPVESELSGRGQIIYRGGDSFEIWLDGYDHFYEPENDLWMGHTYRPYFYFYNWNTKTIERYDEKKLSAEALAELCGFDLAAEVRAAGYEITEIVQWGNLIVTVNYTIPPDESDSRVIYENIIWDCRTKDYWRREERGVTSWQDAGVGGSF